MCPIPDDNLPMEKQSLTCYIQMSYRRTTGNYTTDRSQADHEVPGGSSIRTVSEYRALTTQLGNLLVWGGTAVYFSQIDTFFYPKTM